MRLRTSRPARYTLAVAAAATAVLFRGALTPLLGLNLPFITLLPGILASAWLAGISGGLITTALCTLAAAYFWLPPVSSSWTWSVADIIELIVFLGVGAAMSVITGSMHRALRQVEAQETDSQRLAAIVQGSEDAIVSKTLDGIITSWNPASERMFGYLAAEAVGRPITLIIPSDRREEELEVLRRVRAGHSVDHFETVRLRKDGQSVDVSLTVSPVRNSAGVIIGASKMVRDVTGKKHADDERRALLAREHAARTAAETAQARALFLAEATALVAASLDYETSLASLARLAVPRLADMCAIDVRDEAGGVRRLAVAHVDPQKERVVRELWGRYAFNSRSPVAQVLTTGTPYFVPRMDDSQLSVAVQSVQQFEMLRALEITSAMIVPLQAHREVLGAITLLVGPSGKIFGPADLSLAQDLGRRVGLAVANARLYREAQAANRTKDEFLATLSHELRTPLSAVLGWARMLISKSLDSETTRRALLSIERNAVIQVRLVEDLLDISRITIGKLRLDVRPVVLAPVVQAAIDALASAAEAKEIRLQTILDPLAGPVLGDPDRLQQVVWNVLSNAIKFTPKRGRVQVSLRRVNSHVEIAVSDSGVGIRADALAYIFERFRQVDSSSTRTHGGLGLGLALARHLVELHGGTVKAESPGEGLGSTFRVSLPLMVHHEPQGEERLHPTAAGAEMTLDLPGSLAGLELLVVDDDRDALELLTEILARRGATVKTAASVEEALAALDSWKPAVVLSDIEMPVEDGYTLIRKLRARPREAGGVIPAIAVTAYGRLEDRIRLLSAGFQMYLAKPVDPTELVAVVASLAGRLRSDPG